MASVTTQQISIGNLADLVRGIMYRLTPLEKVGAEHNKEIDRLKVQAQEVQSDIETLKGMADTQDGEAAEHARLIAELTKKVGHLATAVTAHETTIKKLSKTIHGEQVKRGLANARAERAETKLATKTRKTTR